MELCLFFKSRTAAYMLAAFFIAVKIIDLVLILTIDFYLCNICDKFIIVNKG